MSCASAIDRLRALMAGALPPGLAEAAIVIGHPAMFEEYAFGVSLCPLQIREDASAVPAESAGDQKRIETDVLVAVHAPPERGSDAIRLLEHACDVIRDSPRLDRLAAETTATVLLRPLPLDDLARLWRALAAPLQPAVLCTLRVSAPRSRPPSSEV